MSKFHPGTMSALRSLLKLHQAPDCYHSLPCEQSLYPLSHILRGQFSARWRADWSKDALTVGTSGTSLGQRNILGQIFLAFLMSPCLSDFRTVLRLLLTSSSSVVFNSFVTPQTVTCQASLSMGFPRQEYWSWLPFSSLRDHPDPGIELTFSALAGGFFTTELPGKPHATLISELPWDKITEKLNISCEWRTERNLKGKFLRLWKLFTSPFCLVL